MGLATHIVVSKVHFWVIWESGKFGLKKGTGVDPPPPRADNVPFFYRFFSMRASLRIPLKNACVACSCCFFTALSSPDSKEVHTATMRIPVFLNLGSAEWCDQTSNVIFWNYIVIQTFKLLILFRLHHCSTQLPMYLFTRARRNITLISYLDN